jgi:hypothetical protein
VYGQLIDGDQMMRIRYLGGCYSERMKTALSGDTRKGYIVKLEIIRELSRCGRSYELSWTVSKSNSGAYQTFMSSDHWKYGLKRDPLPHLKQCARWANPLPTTAKAVVRSCGLRRSASMDGGCGRIKRHKTYSDSVANWRRSRMGIRLEHCRVASYDWEIGEYSDNEELNRRIWAKYRGF